MICKPLLGILFEDLRLPKKRTAPAAKAAVENTSAKVSTTTFRKQFSCLFPTSNVISHTFVSLQQGSGKKRKRDLTNSDEIAYGTVEDSPLSLLFSGLEGM